jgi:hypothetical protein
MSNGPAFLDSPHSPDLYADGATGFFVFSGNVKITFESVRVDHATSPGPVNRVVIGRLVMPIAGAESLARGLLDFLERRRASNEAQGSATLQ